MIHQNVQMKNDNDAILSQKNVYTRQLFLAAVSFWINNMITLSNFVLELGRIKTSECLVF